MRVNSINNQINNYNKYGIGASSNTAAVSKPVSFSGKEKLADKAAEKLSGLYEKTAKTSLFQKTVKKLSRIDSFKFLLTAESLYLSSWYIFWNLKDKKIDKDQKPQMLTHDILTFGLSTAGAYLAEDRISKHVKTGAEKHFNKHKEFYLSKGKEAVNEEGSNFKQLLAKASETASQTGENLKKGLEDTAALIDSHLKNIAASNGDKAFQSGKEKIAKVQGAVKEAVIKASSDKEAFGSLKKTVTGIAGNIYEQAAARAEADKTMTGINTLKKIVVFGFIYRYAGSVLASPLAIKISSKLFPDKKNKK